ncbi:hypothetical protein E0X81_12055 [Halomonas sp. GDM18]|nr:hypothetical protein E0X81_12055 [Halomonas sp. GDM18]
MNIYFTTGTTNFYSLYDIAVQVAIKYKVVYQGRCKYFSDNILDSFEYDISRHEYYLSWADIIVTHAGAGNVYSMLDRSYRNVVVIPNLERSDKHQLELCLYLDKNQYLYTCHKLCDLPKFLENWPRGDKLMEYNKKQFDAKILYELIRY